MVYFALFCRILSSGLVLWGNPSHIAIILRQVQKEALRCLSKAEFREHFKPLFVQVPVKWSIKNSYGLFRSSTHTRIGGKTKKSLLYSVFKHTFIPEMISFINLTRSSLFFIWEIWRVFTLLATTPFKGTSTIMTAKPASTDGPIKNKGNHILYQHFNFELDSTAIVSILNSISSHV